MKKVKSSCPQDLNTQIKDFEVSVTILMKTSARLTQAMMASASGPRSDHSTDLFETEENRTTTQQQDEDNEPDYDLTLTSPLDFGPESYLTPRRSVRDCALSLDPPLMPRRINQYHRNECEIINREGPKTLHQMVSIIIPSIGPKKDNQSPSPLSPITSSFKLLPRADRFFNSPPRLQLKLTLQDTPDFCLLLQNRNTTESESHMLFCKDSLLFENIQVNTTKSKPMKRSHSLTAMSAKMDVLFCKDSPLFDDIQVNSIKAKPMKRSRSVTGNTPDFCPRRQNRNTTESKIDSHMLSCKDSPLFENIQVNTTKSKAMKRSHSLTAMSAKMDVLFCKGSPLFDDIHVSSIKATPMKRSSSVTGNTPDFCLRRQNRTITESKIDSHMLSCKYGSLFESIQVNTTKSKPMKRSHSLTTMSAKMESKALRSHVIFCNNSPLFENIQNNSIKAKPMKRSRSVITMSRKIKSQTLRSHIHKDSSQFENIQVTTTHSKPMKRSHSLTSISAKMESKALQSHMLFRKYGSLFENSQFNTTKSKAMKKSYSFTAISA